MPAQTVGLKAEESAADRIQQELDRKAGRKERIALVLPYLGFVLLTVFFEAATKGQFLGLKNLVLLVNQSFTMVIVMVGAVFLYSMGCMDMSLGSVMAISSLITAEMYNQGIPLLVCALVGILVSVASFNITASAKNYLQIDPFIASLCVSNVALGIVTAVCKQGKVVFKYSTAQWLTYTSTKLIALILVIGIGYVLYARTTLGKSLRAIGGNGTVAKISGIQVKKVRHLAYTTIGIVVGVASLFTLARSGVVDPTVGGTLNLNVMIGIVLGGFPLSGGANAKFSTPIVGALMVTILTNGLGLMGQANAVGYLVKGILFTLVVALTYERSKGKLIS